MRQQQEDYQKLFQEQEAAIRCLIESASGVVLQPSAPAQAVFVLPTSESTQQSCSSGSNVFSSLSATQAVKLLANQMPEFNGS